MKFGVCGSIDKADLLHAAGYDFIECTVGSLKPEAPESEVLETMNQMSESKIPVEAFNVLLSGGLNVVGEQVDQERIRKYISTAFQRIQAVGGKTVVFGSGRFRRIPEGFDAGQADQQLEWFMKLLAEAADTRGITVVIEPLNKDESNTINTVTEAYEWSKRINHPSLQALADWYHMRKDGESPEVVVACRDRLAHLHIAGLDRYAPAEGDDCDQFAKYVKQSGYNGRLSVECTWKDFNNEIAGVREYLHRLFV